MAVLPRLSAGGKFNLSGPCVTLSLFVPGNACGRSHDPTHFFFALFDADILRDTATIFAVTNKFHLNSQWCLVQFVLELSQI